MQHLSTSPHHTAQIASNFATNLKPGSVLAFYGPLGSGKTTFIQHLAKQLGIAKRVTSPTYIISKSYLIPSTNHYFHHFDLYRLGPNPQIQSLNLPETLASPDSITAIEWPESIQPLLPPHTISIRLQHLETNQRQITISQP